MDALADGDEAESDAETVEELSEEALEDALVDSAGDEAVDDAEADEEAEAEDDAVAEDVLPLGVAVGVGVELAEGVDVLVLLPLGEDGVVGAAVVLVGVLVGVGVLGVSDGGFDGVAAACVACVVVGDAGTVSEASGAALALCVPGRVAKAAIDFSDAIELTDVVAAGVVCVAPAEAAPVLVDEAVVAATLTCADGVCAVAGTDIAEAWAGWLAAVEPRVIAIAAPATPSTPTELRSTPFVGCIALNVGWRPALLFAAATGFTRACRAPVLLSRIAFPSRSPGRKGPP